MDQKRSEAGRWARIVSLASVALAVVALPAGAAEFDVNGLIAAARKEPPITVYATTGKIVDQAKAFTAKYGVTATGKKVNEVQQVELMTREAKASNIVGDVSVSGDTPSAVAQLIPDGIVESWTPPDLADSIAPGARNPLVVVSDAHVWTYNTEVYDKCPVTNVWELTQPEWKRRVAMLDPQAKPQYADFFNQMKMHGDKAMAKAYEALYGKPLKTSEKSATEAWVKAFAGNGPLLAESEAVSDAVGAPGQKTPLFGIMSTAKFRDNIDKGYKLGICSGMQPYVGYLYPGYGLIAKGTRSPNAARLFIHYLMTEEGIADQTIDGKISSNSKVPVHPKEASGIARHTRELMPYDSATALDDFDARQDWADFWRVNYKR
jgi:iron(III) transport system substrate-binding protein